VFAAGNWKQRPKAGALIGVITLQRLQVS